MTLQKQYHFSSQVTPTIATTFDDEYFEYIFEIPVNQKIINVSITNPLTIVDAPIPNPTCQPPITTGLTGTLYLYDSSVQATGNDGVIVYTAGSTNQAIIFEYELLSKLLKVGDVLGDRTVTKVVDRPGHLCYAELTRSSIAYIKDSIYSDDTNTVHIKIKSGFGIIERAAVIGKFQTDLKDIYYYAKFNIPNNEQNNTGVDIDFAEFPIYKELNNINTPDDDRWNSINTSIINPIQTQQSTIHELPGLTVTNSTNIDGTSDLSNPIKINSFFDIPSKSQDISYGIVNYQPKDNNPNILGTIDKSITLNFIRTYVGLPTTHTNTTTSRLINNWLVHTWSVGYMPNGTGSCITPTFSEPLIVYNSNVFGELQELAAYVGTGANRKKYVFFSNNDVLVNSGTHTLNYATEPYGSSAVTEYYHIQSKYEIPCLYNFSVDKLTAVNNTGTNLAYPVCAETKLLKPFYNTDTTITVDNTEDFTDAGYLSMPLYTITPSIAGTTEFRKYEYFGREIVQYTSKTTNMFNGVTRITNTPVDIVKLDSIEYPDLYPSISQYNIY